MSQRAIHGDDYGEHQPDRGSHAGPGLARRVLDDLAAELALPGYEAAGRHRKEASVPLSAGAGGAHVAGWVRFQLLFPVNYNNGAPVPKAEIVAFLAELLQSCASGVTLAEASGIAIDGGVVERDDHLVVTTWTCDATAFRCLVSRWARRLSQRVLCLEVATGTLLEFVPPEEDAAE